MFQVDGSSKGLSVLFPCPITCQVVVVLPRDSLGSLRLWMRSGFHRVLFAESEYCRVTLILQHPVPVVNGLVRLLACYAAQLHILRVISVHSQHWKVIDVALRLLGGHLLVNDLRDQLMVVLALVGGD